MARDILKEIQKTVQVARMGTDGQGGGRALWDFGIVLPEADFNELRSQYVAKHGTPKGPADELTIHTVNGPTVIHRQPVDPLRYKNHPMITIKFTVPEFTALLSNSRVPVDVAKKLRNRAATGEEEYALDLVIDEDGNIRGAAFKGVP